MKKRKRTIDRSLNLHAKAINVIPGGAQTLSKYYGRFVQGVSPAFISHGRGSHVFDMDGNEYIDWTASLGPVILGYGNWFGRTSGDFKRTRMTTTQMTNSLPLPHKYEVELAEKLVDIIPCAEMVRFFKNGSDATTAAVRLAKAVTGRDKVVCCGFHGWNDWYASTLPIPKCKGVFDCIRNDVKKIEYGDLTTLKAQMDQKRPFRPACFILEPMSRACPELADKRYLQKVRELCNEYRVLLVFDEIIMGFRYAMAGGQELYGVVPDLATFGKAMGNGFPIAALVGKRELMREIEHLQVSGTYFGDVAPLAASLDTIEFMEANDVIKALWRKGKKLNPAIRKSIGENELSNVVYLKGFGPWSSLVWGEEFFDEQCLFLQYVVENGILYCRDHFVMYSHNDDDIGTTLQVYSEAFSFVKKCMEKRTVEKELKGRIDGGLFPR